MSAGQGRLKNFWDYFPIVCSAGGGLVGLSIGVLLKSFGIAFLMSVFGLVVGAIIYSLLFILIAPAELQEKLLEESGMNRKDQQRRDDFLQLGIKCPTCNATNIERISAAKKIAYVAGCGIFAPAFKSVRSQFECKKCGYKW